MAILVVIDGPAKEQKFSLTGSRLTMFGRDAGCSFQIVDPELSRYHLQIRHAEDQDRHFAIDFQTKNGVFVNRQRIQAETLLNDGDVITIGGTTMVYAIDDAMGAQRAYEAWKKLGQGHVHTITND